MRVGLGDHADTTQTHPSATEEDIGLGLCSHVMQNDKWIRVLANSQWVSAGSAGVCCGFKPRM